MSRKDKTSVMSIKRKRQEEASSPEVKDEVEEIRLKTTTGEIVRTPDSMTFYFTKRFQERSNAPLAKVAKYSPQIKITAMALNASGYTVKQIAAALDVGESTITSWITREYPADSIEFHAQTVLSNAIGRSLSTKTKLLTNKLLHHAMQEPKLEKAGTGELIKSAALLHNMTRLESNQSTANVAYRDLASPTGSNDRRHEVTDRINSLLTELQEAGIEVPQEI